MPDFSTDQFVFFFNPNWVNFGESLVVALAIWKLYIVLHKALISKLPFVGFHPCPKDRSRAPVVDGYCSLKKFISSGVPQDISHSKSFSTFH